MNEEEQEIDVDETSIETIARNATVVVPSSSVTVQEEIQALDLTPPRTLQIVSSEIKSNCYHVQHIYVTSHDEETKIKETETGRGTPKSRRNWMLNGRKCITTAYKMGHYTTDTLQ